MPTSSLPKIFLFSLLIISMIITHTCSQCLNNQKSLLLELKNELILEPGHSTKVVQWNQTSDCCSWFGVECDGAGNVKGLQLDDEGIHDSIGNSSSLFKLKYLEKLNLGYNFFNAAIPRGFRSLTYLTHLNLSMAGFTGQVPLELSFLTKLVSLDISIYDPNYYYYDTDPPIKLVLTNLDTLVLNLTKLRVLHLDGVNISSQKSEWSYIIPSYLPHLTSLSLSNCHLSGPLDKSLLLHHSLSSLRLDENNLSSVVPDLIVNSSNLTTLSFRNCSLRGYFPEKIFLIPTLHNLDLSDNELLSGSIPPFTKIGSLKSVVLSGTNFSGSIPSSIGNLKTLSEINLSSCKFTGPILPTLGNLTQLTTLDLSSNFFSGPLPSTLFADFSNLESLWLDNNLFSGNIPMSLFGLPSLHIISLYSNQFTEQVEEFPVVNVSNIRYIDLSNNQLEGPIPYSLLKLENLTYLDLSSNLLSGTFRLENTRNLPSLTVLDLSNNFLSVNCSSLVGFPLLDYLGLASCNLSEFPSCLKHTDWNSIDLSNNRILGEIPNWIWGNGRNIRLLNLSSNLLTDLQKPYYIPTSLDTLDLHSNKLLGELHLSLPADSNLLFLYVASNSLSGSIPTSLCNARNLAFLDVSDNKLSGGIPPCLFENMENLQVFNLGRNTISGGIPHNISQNCGLEVLDLNNNTLDGSVPKSLGNCKSLELINVGNNIFHGSFPCMRWSSLRILVLRSNRLHGEVRCQNIWPDIQIVDISANNFTGNLELVNFTSWRGMMLKSDPELRQNRLDSHFLQSSSSFYYPVGVTIIIKGLELEIVKIWPEFSAIDFSCNKFQGEIPDAIGDLQSLHLLNLSHNFLTSAIPRSLGALTELESLDLSGNQLTGAIPGELADLTFLSVLNLSFNKLEGKIPKGHQFQTFSNGSFEGNPSLCGFPLSISCTRVDVNESSPPESEEEIEWEFVSAALGYVVGLGIIVWILVFCRSFREKYFNKIDEVSEEIFADRNRRRRKARRRLVRSQDRRQ